MIVLCKRYGLIFLFLIICSSCFADLASSTVYLTWQRDPQTTMTIQWLSPADQRSSCIEYQVMGDSEWQSINGSSFCFPQASQYLIHRVELTQLISNTRYRFRILPSRFEYSFLTMPSHLENPIRFVVGGDMYHDHIDFMKETSREAAATQPHFALVGGDIAYAVGRTHSPQNIERWIEWIKAWHECMICSDGRLIPVLAAIGNHDLSGHFDQTPEQAKIFSSLFPMPGEQIYNVLDFGSYLSLFILDSGHANPIGGNQTAWLKQVLEERQDVLHRFAIYHVPAYPSVRPFQQKHSALIRRHWVPLFEKGGLSLAFEHHDHTYKRTHPLLNNKIHSKGVIYLGDGAWGVKQPRRPLSVRKPFYLDKFIPARHFLLIKLYPQEQQIMSIDSQGQILDEYVHSLEMAEPSLSLSNSY